jgi:MGT family glycosyltransferase
MRFLLAPFPERGHFTLMLAIGQRLVDAGHTVGYTCAYPLRDIVAAAGIEAVVYDPPSFTPPSSAARNLDPRWMKRWYAYRALQSFVPEDLAAARRVVEDFAPDVICADGHSYHTIIAAERAGIPWGAVSATLLPMHPSGWSCTLTEAMSSIQGNLLQCFEQAGMPRARLNFAEVISPWLNVVFGTEALVPRSLGTNDWSWLAGPIQWRRPRGDEVAFPWEALTPERPLIYVSFGGGESLAYPESTLVNVAASLDESEAQFVFVLHHFMDTDLPARLPRNVIAVRYAPQLALIDRAAVVVTHGGYGTVAETLLRARPMLVMPLGHEQPLQAELVERAGIGLQLARDAAPAAIGAALRRLLAEPGFRERVTPIAEDYARHDGTQAAVEHLIALGRERTPRMPPLTPAS